MRAATRRLLISVAQRYPCVIVSGRGRADLATRVTGIPIWHLAGNHGFEPWAENAKVVSRVTSWANRLSRQLAKVSGVVIENKRYSITVHYRYARPKRRAISAVRRAVRMLPAARAIAGTEAINVLPSPGLDKGIAVDRARRLLRCDTAIFVGDDDSDEDVFKRRSRPIIGIRIGSARRTKAQYRLPTQLEIDSFLRTLLQLRPRPPRNRRVGRAHRRSTRLA
jgi:trehalose 6-phosphate phosphatase